MATRRLAWPAGVLAVVVVSPPLAAQTEEPAPIPHHCDQHDGAVGRVCRAAFDAVSWMIPVGGLAAGGGNPSLGTAGGSGGFGELTVTLRGNFARTVLPDPAYDGVGDTVRAVRRLPVALPRVDVRLGVFQRELPVGTASVDLLGSVIPIPKGATAHIRFGPEVRSLGDVALGFAYGLRIAMLPSGGLPTVSLNVARTTLPAFTYGDLNGASTYAYSLSVGAINGRLLLSKRWGGFELTGGGGVDLLSGRYSITYLDPADRTPFPRADSTMSTMRIVTLANAAFILGPTRLSLEGGFLVGKDDQLATVFEAHDTRSGTFFGGIGIGFKL